MNEILKILEEVSRKHPTKAPGKLVEKFIESLREEKVEVERPQNLTANYFVGKKINTALILAH